MIFLLLIISCVIGIWIRGINNLERFYVLNIGKEDFRYPDFHSSALFRFRGGIFRSGRLAGGWGTADTGF